MTRNADENHTDVFSVGRSACLIADIEPWAGGMSGMAAKDRQTSVLFRLSREEKAQLHEEAAGLGITLQALLERRLLGKLDATRRPPGRTPKSERDEPLIDAKELMAS